MSYPPPPQFAAQPPGGSGGKPRLRGRIPLRLALIFGVVGLALVIVGGVILAKKAYGAAKDFPRVSISAGSGQVTFKNTGDYLAYYEANNADDINTYPLVLVRLTSPSGKAMVLDTLYGGRKLADLNGKDDLNTDLTYDVDGHHGVAYYQYHISEAGTYKVEFDVSESSVKPPAGATMAFGKSIGKSLVAGVLLVLPGVGLLIAAVVLLIVGLVKRSNSKKELRAGPGGYGGAPPGYGYPPQGGAFPPQGGYPGGYPQGGYPQGGNAQGGNPQAGGYPPPGS